MSGVRLSRALLPRMLERNSGNIVFVASEAAIAVKPFMIHYSMTKTAQLAVARYSWTRSRSWSDQFPISNL